MVPGPCKRDDRGHCEIGGRKKKKRIWEHLRYQTRKKYKDQGQMEKGGGGSAYLNGAKEEED